MTCWSLVASLIMFHHVSASINGYVSHITTLPAHWGNEYFAVVWTQAYIGHFSAAMYRLM